jgi:outer membrane lipoprotein carrier protein
LQKNRVRRQQRAGTRFENFTQSHKVIAVRAFMYAMLAFVSLTSIANTAPLSESELENLLAAIRQNRTTQADFQEERVMRLMRKPVVSSGTVWFQPPNKFRREVKGNSPSVSVSDGRELWIYYPNFKSAERYPLGKGSPLDASVAAINSALNLENIETSFKVTATKIENGYELQLLPRTAPMKRVFQKLDLRINEKFRVELTDMLLPNGDRIVTTYSNQTRPPIPASTFEFKPPPGTEVTTPLGT